MVALPVVLYQLWAFVAPGLYSHEKRLVLPLVVSSTLLFVAGVAFCYFLVIPGMSKFIQAFAPTTITAAPDIEQYFGFVLTLFLVFGIAFEVPIAVIVLARMGVVTIAQLKQVRGYFIVGAFIVAAVVTPPDVISQLALAIPMIILYEIGIIAAQIFIKTTQAPSDEDAAADKPAA
jgi:sec-independent protein translocase protein TatC